MISGAMHIPRVQEESICRTSKDYRFTDVGVYKIHSTSLMANIPFGEAAETKEPIDPTIFINDKETKLKIKTSIKTQNYLSTFYVGRAPLEFYSGKGVTKMGREFVLLCRQGNPNADWRVFGTETAIHGYNKNAGEMSSIPGGGDS